mmetsp:Transcript_65839/g.124509  ORF Transcript_65839/g.124509 Transcript_65839/m.124509 type:complete len:257 (+) Transcript_65839:120-890(+)
MCPCVRTLVVEKALWTPGSRLWCWRTWCFWGCLWGCFWLARSRPRSSSRGRGGPHAAHDCCCCTTIIVVEPISKLIVVNYTIVILIHGCQERVKNRITHWRATRWHRQPLQHRFQLGEGDHTVAISVELLEDLFDLVSSSPARAGCRWRCNTSFPSPTLGALGKFEHTLASLRTSSTVCPGILHCAGPFRKLSFWHSTICTFSEPPLMHPCRRRFANTRFRLHGVAWRVLVCADFSRGAMRPWYWPCFSMAAGARQ